MQGSRSWNWGPFGIALIRQARRGMLECIVYRDDAAHAVVLRHAFSSSSIARRDCHHAAAHGFGRSHRIGNQWSRR
jgi:hypothetical protein